MTLSIVTFKWRSPPGYRSEFTGRHVDVLRRMVRRNYSDPHRFLCITDDPSGITEPDIEIYSLWPDLGTVRNPSGRALKNPSCYRRLRVFARNAGAWLGDRFVVLDLDTVIVGDMRPLWNRPEDFVIWRSATSGNPYNGSMVLHRAGTRPRLWEEFDPEHTPSETRRHGYYGSDQAWIAYCLGPNEATWTARDGVLSHRIDMKTSPRLPVHAKIVFFHGRNDPWTPEVYNRTPWVREHWK